MNSQPKIYCDTCALAPNIRDPHSLPELVALKRLRVLCQEGKCTMLRSHIVRAELESTECAGLRERLKADYDLLDGILQDEKLLAIHHTNYGSGSFVNYPMISDVQDPKIFEEIYQKFKRAPRRRRDAEHLTQAICNGCDVFLTRDKEILSAPMRQWIEQQYAPLRVQLPSELLAEFEHRCAGQRG